MTALRNALTAFEAEYLPSGIRETPEWQAVLALAAGAGTAEAGETSARSVGRQSGPNGATPKGGQHG